MGVGAAKPLRRGREASRSHLYSWFAAPSSIFKARDSRGCFGNLWRNLRKQIGWRGTTSRASVLPVWTCTLCWLASILIGWSLTLGEAYCRDSMQPCGEAHASRL
ncbi:dnaJ homolog subfamily C member 28 isoform X2 [Vulpes lagopus]|uniref:dnaJ homolog subfamily C member 28 isoform X2 n=1 Tax=Vulpes lagopus TaxID=494514 RepID=UPI001BC91A6D|nr:dnaJ homolog subfamily C member 28 isoform X2 [Vulpes lagopus]